jgi:hypothetical protein
MKIFLDTEFWESGPSRPIQLISLGLVSETGNELYVVNKDFDWEGCDSDWLHANVKAQLEVVPRIEAKFAAIGELVRDWVLREAGAFKPEFVGYYADYDWVVFCQLFGSMVDLPKGFPMRCLDIKQLAAMLGDPKLPEQGKGEHCALLDARWNKQAWEFLMKLAGEA